MEWVLGVGAVALLIFFCAVAVAGYLVFDQVRGSRLLQEGYSAVQNGELNLATAKLAAALQRRLTKVDMSYAYANRAYCHYRLGRPSEALRDFDEALRLNPEITWAYEFRAAVHLNRGDHDKAFEDYSETIRRDPNSSEAYFQRGRIALARGDTALAVRDFRELVRLNPQEANVYVRLGEAQIQHEELHGALASFESALRLAPFHQLAPAKRLHVLRLQGREGEAAAGEAQALREVEERTAAQLSSPTLDATFKESYSLLQEGLAAARAGDHPRAIEYYRKALSGKLSAENVSEAYLNLGHSEVQQGEIEQAQADFERSIASDPSNVAAYLSRAELHERLGNHQAVADDCTTALLVDPNASWGYLMRSRAFRNLQQPRRALEDLTRAIKLKPPAVDNALNDLAWLLATSPDQSVRDGRRAVETAEQACEMTKWERAAYVDTLAAAQAESGDFGTAVISQMRAVALVEEIHPSRAGMEERLQLYREQKPYREELRSTTTTASAPVQ
ncbi:MAG: tetratricopeptide repeat protein [Chthoniobacterales bacterium]|nr:tetratricopeptide repeat protein [Chthoniobacterales bacterium]